jgi:tetratricopeptide (TPR) repeat protein
VRKIVQITVLVFLLTGCSSLKQGWNNFTAYYNTFYNAKKFYNSGLEKNRNQQPEIIPHVPIRVHPSPTDAGLEDFEKAIEKGSAILRDHSNSKFVVPALFIIGKSYYHRSDFFAALEKFEELGAIAEGEKRQEAVVWQAMTYLELSNYDQGIEVLEFEIENNETWLPQW